MIATATARKPKLTTNNNSRRNSICHLFAEPLLALLTSLPLRQTPTPRAAPTRLHHAPAKPSPAAAQPSAALAAPASNASARPNLTTPSPAPPHTKRRSLPPPPQIRFRFPWPCPPYELGCKRTKSRKVANRTNRRSHNACGSLNPTFSTLCRLEAADSGEIKLRKTHTQSWPRKHGVEIHTQHHNRPTSARICLSHRRLQNGHHAHSRSRTSWRPGLRCQSRPAWAARRRLPALPHLRHSRLSALQLDHHLPADYGIARTAVHFAASRMVHATALGAGHHHQHSLFRLAAVSRTQPQHRRAALPHSGAIHHALCVRWALQHFARSFQRAAGIQYRHRRSAFQSVSRRMLLAGHSLFPWQRTGRCLLHMALGNQRDACGLQPYSRISARRRPRAAQHRLGHHWRFQPRYQNRVLRRTLFRLRDDSYRSVVGVPRQPGQRHMDRLHRLVPAECRARKLHASRRAQHAHRRASGG